MTLTSYEETEKRISMEYPRLGSEHKINHDGFVGTVIGYYRTKEGKEGVVLQQVGTQVVHVYGLKWLNPQSTESTRS